MKTSPKEDEPTSLVAYRIAQPNGTWDAMRNDPHHGGQQAYIDIKRALVRGQRCLCAYCELRLADGTSDAELDAHKAEQRIEHFHPKEDTGPSNWALHWPNLWAMCKGGSDKPLDGVVTDPTKYLEPLPENLSCDAFKGHQVESGKLPLAPEGELLAPNEVPPFPCLFQFTQDGTPEPWLANCAAVTIPTNRYPTTSELVAATIVHLNLGCNRLKRARQIARAQLEKNIEAIRKRTTKTITPQQAMQALVGRLFPNDPASPWPQFFTLLRWRLGKIAEDHLQAIGYTG